MDNIFRNQTIIVTGAAGSVGQKIVHQILPFMPAEIRLLENNEGELFFMSELYQEYNNVTAYLGDVRDFQKVTSVCRGGDIIFHCAAFKHVFFSEYNPFEAVQTNILGTKNIVEAALNNGIKCVIFTSSDKAVNPTSVMGTSKLMGERLVTAANIGKHGIRQRFASVRFGNVIGSRGSVYQVFLDQVKKGGPVTITNPDMTRFIMSLEQAARFVIEGAVLAMGGEVFVTKMQVISIMDLAEVMIDILAPFYSFRPSEVGIKVIGAKPGEKLYEELLSLEETGRTLELKDMFVVLPAFRAMYQNIDYNYPLATGQPVIQPYNSSQSPSISKEEIKKFLVTSHLLPPELIKNHHVKNEG